MTTYTAYTPYGNIIAKGTNLEELIKLTDEKALEIGGDCEICEDGDELNVVYETHICFCEA